MNCEHCGDDLSGETEPLEAQRDCKALSIGRKWMEDSSLESWFPITAEELTHLRSECDKKDAEIVRLKGEVEAMRELHIMQLAGISTASP